jgi:hypothetical protein
VKNESAAQYILALRENPRISALMAAELAQDNRQSLEGSLGREVGNAELYMAHFLGAGGAAKFIGEMEANGAVAASAVVPAAARANASVFYEHGRPLTLDQVFARFEGRFGDQTVDSASVPPTMPAMSGVPAQLQSEPERTATFAASAPALAALQALQSAVQEAPERGAQPSLRMDLANQMLTLNLLQAFTNAEDDKPNEWLA